jgi:uncharacterized protein YndB with AHSA1/START domain
MENNMHAGAAGGAASKEMVLTRLFHAPRELVFRAFTEPEQLARWWGPRGWGAPRCEFDARPGGKIHIDMAGPAEWGVMPMGGTVHEVLAPERLVFTSRAFGDDEQGWQLEVRNTLTFTEHDGGTLLRLQAVVTKATPEAGGALAGMELGWEQSLDKLAEVLAVPQDRRDDLEITLPAETEIRITRTFKAPPELLYAVCTEPQHLQHWWGGGMLQVVACESDLRVGGGYRYVLRDPDGTELVFRGTYLELLPGQRQVQTFVFEPFPDAEAVETASYEAVPGGTRLTVTVRHQTRANRDGHLNSGMELGLRASYSALDALLRTLLPA